MARITVDELNTLLSQGQSPLIIDVRNSIAQKIDRIPGALVLSVDDLDGGYARDGGDGTCVSANAGLAFDTVDPVRFAWFR